MVLEGHSPTPLASVAMTCDWKTTRRASEALSHWNGILEFLMLGDTGGIGAGYVIAVRFFLYRDRVCMNRCWNPVETWKRLRRQWISPHHVVAILVVLRPLMKTLSSLPPLTFFRWQRPYPIKCQYAFSTRLIMKRFSNTWQPNDISLLFSWQMHPRT